MNKLIPILLALIFSNSCIHTNPTEKARSIVEEGKRLYRSEMASWHGTDIFLDQYKNRENIGGYFSYTANDTSKCVFFSKRKPEKIIGMVSFDSTYNTSTATVDLTQREFELLEQNLFELRAKALDLIQIDTLFKGYQNTNQNLIPLINNGEKKVYVLTCTNQGGLVIFGNDYLITFDENNSIVSKKQLHNNIIITKYGNSQDKKEVEGAFHTHSLETGDLITSTDICTLMLYSKFAGWKTYNVISEKYSNTWNCETNTLTVTPMDPIDKVKRDWGKEKKK